MSEFTMAHELHNMVPAPAASAVVQVMFRSEDGIMACYGTTAVNAAPLTDADVYAPGCQYTLIVDSSSLLYLNTGTKASPSWTDQK